MLRAEWRLPRALPRQHVSWISQGQPPRSTMSRRFPDLSRTAAKYKSCCAAEKSKCGTQDRLLPVKCGHQAVPHLLSLTAAASFVAGAPNPFGFLRRTNSRSLSPSPCYSDRARLTASKHLQRHGFLWRRKQAVEFSQCADIQRVCQGVQVFS